MITRKDLAPLDDASLEFWINNLKFHKDKKALWTLYNFCQDFFAWVCTKNYGRHNCYGCKNQEDCMRCRITMDEVKKELKRRKWFI